jgi:hypothetical protein
MTGPTDVLLALAVSDVGEAAVVTGFQATFVDVAHPTAVTVETFSNGQQGRAAFVTAAGVVVADDFGETVLATPTGLTRLAGFPSAYSLPAHLRRATAVSPGGSRLVWASPGSLSAVPFDTATLSFGELERPIVLPTNGFDVQLALSRDGEQALVVDWGVEGALLVR